MDLEPLQPLLKKCIDLLETEVLPLTSETTRPRVQLERINVWIGIKSLLGFLEPPVFEEGLLERYPIFLSIVLNHISDDSLEFSYAVNCLRILFEMLGCKLWLRTTLSPSVIRNTLLGQCFHTRNEKSHKEIFDLFQPFLQSLEDLQDGEHEKQRRHFLYFLNFQVANSSNFSILMRKKACQIALLIVHRGYKMNPPSPAFECAHMWGPSLVNSLRDSSLHDSLRQPAFDLIQTIIVSDAAALITSMLNLQKAPLIDRCISTGLNDGEDDHSEMPITFLGSVAEDSDLWGEFTAQSKFTSPEYRGWMCIPMLWLETLVDSDSSIFPLAFSKAVFWALSRFSMVEPENTIELSLSVRAWLSSCATEISNSFGWKVPTGSDDGGDGKVTKNSVKASEMWIPLVRTFKRFTANFVVKMEERQLWKQWSWEPRMGESLILLLPDPNDNVRQVARCILEHVSNTRGITGGLQFLCSRASSLYAIFLGLRHALKLVSLDAVLLNFQTLHHFFFILCKLLKEGVPNLAVLNDLNVSKFSSQGGFLLQPVFDSLPANVHNVYSSGVDSKTWEKFSLILSELAWPSVRKCLLEGKAFIDYKISQMACVRVLEILPVVYERLCPLSYKLSWTSEVTRQNVVDFEWLQDVCDWGKSSLAVVVRYWKQTMLLLLDLLKGRCTDSSASTIRTIEKLLSCESVAIDEIMEQVSCLSVSLTNEASYIVGETNLESKPSPLEGLSFDIKYTAPDAQPFSLEEADVQILDATTRALKKRDADNVIVLSDDEKEKKTEVVLTGIQSTDFLLDGEKPARTNERRGSFGEKNISVVNSQKLQASDTLRGNLIPTSLSKNDFNKGTPLMLKCDVNDSLLSHKVSMKKSSDKTDCSISTDPSCINVVSEAVDATIKELVHETVHDSRDITVKSGRCNGLPKPTTTAIKRQVIPLNLPFERRSSYLNRVEAGSKRFKPPRLDEWFKPILEMDYFAAVGLASASTDENQSSCKLKEVPVCFESPEQYMEIFQPLVLEEFKAHLNSSFQDMSSSDEMCSGTLSVLSIERVDDFHLVRCIHDDSDFAASRSYSDNDLLVLTRQPFHSSSHDVHIVGKVERRERDNKRNLNILLIRFYFQSRSSRLNRARKLLIVRSKWHASRIMNITPQLREFQALSSIRDIPLLPIILKPVGQSLGYKNCRKIDLGMLSQSMQRNLKSSFNESQLVAISVAIGSNRLEKDFELSLIQGPPGTGKTRTIVAMVTALLATPVQWTKDTTTKPTNSSLSSTNTRLKISQSVSIAKVWQAAALARQLGDEQKNLKSVNNSGTGRRRRVLICAQSNAAVDELVSRISNEGLCGTDGTMYKPYLVRVGNAKTIHPNSLPFFIDTLVEQRLAEELLNSDDIINNVNSDATSIRSTLEKLVDRIRFYEAKRANLSDSQSDLKSSHEDEFSKERDGKDMSGEEIEMKLRKLYQQKKKICADLATAQAREKKANEERKAHKYKLRKSILKEAEIVVTTLSGCGGDLYGVCSESVSNYKFSTTSEDALFDAVVIDEAAQALEPATLIPLQLLRSSGTKCIMVGDPKQLPATVLSDVASTFLYQCSMFERLQRAGHPVIMLNEQYRMHPEICRFPSLYFYDSKLLNGNQMSNISAPFHEIEGLGPYIFFDIVDGRELHGKNSGALSLYNEHEADAAVEVLRFFKKSYPSEFAGGRIGVITPYKSQLSLLRSRFSSALGSSTAADMEFNTVDGFQGREVDILILSTVRAAEDPRRIDSSRVNSSNRIGFVADVRRMNVALTRAKISLWILGNARTLRTNDSWAALIRDAKDRNLVISVQRPYESLFQEAFMKRLSFKVSDDPSSKPKHGKKVRDSKLLAEQSEINKTRETYGIKGGNHPKIHRDKHDSSAAEEDSRSCKILRDDEQKINEKQKGSCTGKGKAIGTNSRSNESSGHQRSQMETSEMAPKQADRISKRKQRDDVEALLSSALITNRFMKSQTSLPSKRPHPSSPRPTPTKVIKPPKQRKDPH